MSIYDLIRGFPKAIFNSDFNAIKTINPRELYGYAADTKPTTGIMVGSTFYEFDTKNLYIYNGTTWMLM